MSSLVDTRNALHALAEQVLAAALHRATGRIGLRTEDDLVAFFELGRILTGG